jgi:hypothetical protein
MFTPKGCEVLVLVLRISLRRSSGVGWVRAVSWGEGRELAALFSVEVGQVHVSE